jgi:ribosome maturation factor RimP
MDLVDVEWTTERGARTLRVVIERSGTDGLVSLDECADVSRELSVVLDGGVSEGGAAPTAPELISCAYQLEVSSPGVERKLRGPRDFDRFVGRLARVKLTSPAPDGQRLLRGRLEPHADGHVAVRVDGKRIEVPATQVSEAHLVYEPRAEPGPVHEPGALTPAGAPPPNATAGRIRPGKRGKV